MTVTRDDVISAIKQAKVVNEGDQLRADINLTDQGIDSLGVFNVILVLQETYSIEIPDPDVDQLNTVDELVAYLNSRLS